MASSTSNMNTWNNWGEHDIQGMTHVTLNTFKDCHLGCLNLKIYRPTKFCHGHIFEWSKKKTQKTRGFDSHVSYQILRSYKPRGIFHSIGQGFCPTWNNLAQHNWSIHSVYIVESDTFPSSGVTGLSVSKLAGYRTDIANMRSLQQVVSGTPVTSW